MGNIAEEKAQLKKIRQQLEDVYSRVGQTHQN